MKRPCSFVAIVLSFAFCLVSSARCLAYPALTEVSVGTIGPDTVYYSVNDPSRGYIIDSRTVNTPTNLFAKDGLVVWNSKDGLGRDILWYAVYDPGLGRWQTQFSFFLTVASTPVLADGVVSCLVTGYGIPDIITSVFFATYDPAAGAWRTWAHEVPATGPEHLANKQGIVVFGYSDAVSAKVFYFLYDPGRAAWIMGNYTQGGAAVVGVSVADFQAQAQVGGYSLSWGYDPGPGAWYVGPTIPRAYFAVQPAAGHLPLLAWFTDMSIGGNTWSYHFLDINAWIIGRSGFRTYTQTGSFEVQYGVTGPGGSNNVTKTVRVTGYPAALPLLLFD